MILKIMMLVTQRGFRTFPNFKLMSHRRDGVFLVIRESTRLVGGDGDVSR